MAVAPPPGYVLDPNDPTRAIPAGGSVAPAPPPPPASRLTFVPFPKTAEPQTPDQQAHTQAETNKTNKEAANIVTPHVLTADEVAANPTLNPSTTWAMDSTGNIKAVGSVPHPFKVGDSDAINHAWDVIDSISQARQLATKPLSTGTMAATVSGIPIVGGLVGQNHANLQTKLGQISGDLRQLGITNLYQSTGSKGVGSIARTASEQQALQSSMAPLGYVDQGGGHMVSSGPQPDAQQLGQGLDQAQNIYVRHLARLYNMDPDNPQTMQLLGSAINDPARRGMFLKSLQGQVAPAQGGPTPAGDNGITKSAPPPAISGLGGDSAAVSTDTQAVTDPNMARIAPALEQYLAADPKKVSNAMILGFVQKNGVDLSSNPTLAGSLNAALQYRMSKDGAAWRAQGGNYTVDPTYNQPLSGARKVMAEVSGAAPGGVPVGATAAGAADAATLGAIPDVAGVVHAVTGTGPSRADVINARDVSAEQHPLATFLGNAAGGVASPLARGGGALRTAGMGGLYGFLGSDDPDLQSRLINMGLGASVGLAAHGVSSAALGGAAAGYRTGKNAVLSAFAGDPEQLAVENALGRAANQMPPQNVDAATARILDLNNRGASAPAAAGLNRSGQDYLARLTSGSAGARTAADQAAADYRKALPPQLAGDFNQAIADAAPANVNASEFLSRPTRDIASDVQDMAGREYQTGIAPIANEPLQVTPDLADALTHERINGAIKDALSNHQLDDTTRTQLRALPAQLKAVSGADQKTMLIGNKNMTADQVRAEYPKDANAILASAGMDKTPSSIALTVDGARNIATALDRTAAKMQEGTEGAVELHSLSGDIRNAIGQQYPEYSPVNDRYASRMRAIDAMDTARRNFLGESPEQIDALAKGAKNFSDTAGEPEFTGPGGPQGAPQPSNRQFAIAGAREASETRAGAGTGSGGASVARTIAEGPNQQGRNAMVVGAGADKLAANAGAKADVADAVDRITSGASGEQTSKWWNIGKTLMASKVTGGAHTMAAHALAGLPGMSSEDAARVVRVYLDADSAPQALKSLANAYGANKARFIMARMAAVGSAASTVRGTPATSSASKETGGAN